MFLTAHLVMLFFTGTLGSPNNGRVVNGTDAEEGKIPYVVSVRRNNEHDCGGSILTRKHILTAAHCVNLIHPSCTNLSVQYGVTKISNETGSKNIVNVTKIMPNIHYQPEFSFKSDIAILEVDPPIVFSLNAQPVKLPRAFNATPENAVALLSGWGLPYSGGSGMGNLQKVHITVYPDEECERVHAKTGPTERDFHICAGVPEGGKGQCSGDSGGPLVVDGVQVGIVSWSIKPCGIKDSPGVYTRVSTQIPWILAIINE